MRCILTWWAWLLCPVLAAFTAPISSEVMTGWGKYYLLILPSLFLGYLIWIKIKFLFSTNVFKGFWIFFKYLKKTRIDTSCSELMPVFFFFCQIFASLGGFSMGGCMAMHLAYRNHRDVAGVFALSSFLNKASAVYQVSSRLKSKQNKQTKKPWSTHNQNKIVIKQLKLMHSWYKFSIPRNLCPLSYRN